MPPQALGNPIQGALSVYYVPPENTAPNMFAAFQSGFLQERTPLARAVFKQRLEQMKPVDRSAAMVDLLRIAQQEREANQNMIKAVLGARAAGGGAAGGTGGMHPTIVAALINAQSKFGTTAMELESEAALAGVPGEREQAAINDAMRVIGGKVGTDSENAIAADVMALAGDLKGLSAAQQGTVHRQLMAMTDSIGDPTARETARIAISEKFANTPAAPNFRMRGIGADLMSMLGGGEPESPEQFQERLAQAKDAAGDVPLSDVGQMARDLFSRFSAEHGTTPDIDFSESIFKRPVAEEGLDTIESLAPDDRVAMMTGLQGLIGKRPAAFRRQAPGAVRDEVEFQARDRYRPPGLVFSPGRVLTPTEPEGAPAGDTARGPLLSEPGPFGADFDEQLAADIIGTKRAREGRGPAPAPAPSLREQIAQVNPEFDPDAAGTALASQFQEQLRKERKVKNKRGLSRGNSR